MQACRGTKPFYQLIFKLHVRLHCEEMFLIVISILLLIDRFSATSSPSSMQYYLLESGNEFGQSNLSASRQYFPSVMASPSNDAIELFFTGLALFYNFWFEVRSHAST